MAFFVFNAKKILKNLLIFAFVFLFVFGVFFAVRNSSIKANSKLLGLCVVIDAGHGGIDSGAVGKNLKVKESDVNLAIAKKLKKNLERIGIKVVETRTSADGLYTPFAKNKKQSEMQKRKEIIENSNADLVISIHQNSFPLSSVKGAGIYYKPGDEEGQSAGLVIKGEIEKIDEIEKVVFKSADFFVLNCTSIPGIMVECAYLSNEQDEKFISSEKGQEKMAYAIFCGVIKHFKIENY